MKPLIKTAIAALGITVAALGHAATVPVGLQANVSAATVSGWGFTACASSPGLGSLDMATVLAACQGDYLAMAVRNVQTGDYAIFGAGEWNTVTRVVYTDRNGDNDINTRLNNWSNGLNFYRTSGQGSWGFTTIDRTALNSADILLQDGQTDFSQYCACIPEAPGALAKGLSWHVDGSGDLFGGWAFNTTGNNYVFIDWSYERVLLVADAPSSVPEPASLAVVGAALLAAAGARRRRAAR